MLHNPYPAVSFLDQSVCNSLPIFKSPLMLKREGRLETEQTVANYFVYATQSWPNQWCCLKHAHTCLILKFEYGTDNRWNGCIIVLDCNVTSHILSIFLLLFTNVIIWIFWHVIWCDEINEYVFQKQNSFCVCLGGRNFSFEINL